ncbi:MAG TPA: hypothetical protein VJU83_03100 [Burkholderiales bacterium]|nr:hypothetical protein [Burkholderiales bacterium]
MRARFSGRKRLLFRLALGAISAMSVCVFLSAMLLHNIGVNFFIKFSAVLLFIASLGVCAVLLHLLDEYSALVRPGQRTWKKLTAMRWVEVRALTAACPAGIKVAVIGVGALAFFQCLRLGHFAVAQPGIAAPDVIGILSGATFFYSLAIPFLLAAAYMPGSYAEELRSAASRAR